MTSFKQIPSSARNFVVNIFSIFHTTNNHTRNTDKGIKEFSTPQIDRKLKVERRCSDTTMNDRERRIKLENIENWEPNVQEKELLRRTWSDEFDFLYNLGSAIYTYIFYHNPNCKKLFPYLEHYGDNWKDSKEFRGQALKFVQTLSQVVKNLYHTDRLVPYLYGIGQRHCKFASRGFKHEYWDIFEDAMEHSLSDHMNKLPDFDEQTKKNAVKVWRTLSLYVVSHMKKGFLDGLKNINAHPPLVK
ncbi:unnamed protein product [Auanema sp. JU1783]|nr:unnamed protein product [Auanema sp. JU1783]